MHWASLVMGRVLFFSFFFSIFFYLDLSRASDVLDFQMQEESTLTEQPQAREQMLASAVEKVSTQVIRNAIGGEVYQKNEEMIADQILKSSDRFVIMVKPGAIEPNGQGFKMTVGLKVSLANLRSLLD